MKIGSWDIRAWRSHGLTFLFHYEWTWNYGKQKRLYILFWEINFEKIEQDNEE